MANLQAATLTIPTNVEGTVTPVTYDLKDATARAGAVELVKDTAGWIGLNELPNKLVSGSNNHVNYSVKEDKSVEIYTDEGGSTAQTTMLLVTAADNYKPKAGQKILSVSDEATAIQIVVAGYNGTTWVKNLANTNTHTPLNIDYDGYERVGVYLLVNANNEIDHKIAYPMIVDADAYALSPAYEPHHDTVEAELAKKANAADVAAIATVIPSSATSSNKVATAEDVTATVDLMKDTTGWIGKNLFITKNGEGTSTAGLTETKNADDSITLNGTTTSEYIFPRDSVSRGRNLYLVEAGKTYVFNVGVTNPLIKLQVYYKETSSTQWARLVDDVSAGNNLIFTVPDNYYDLWIRFDVISGRTLNNVTVYPMITDANVYPLSPSYEPYHGSVEEVKADKTEVQTSISLLSDTVGWKGKNKLKNTANSSTISSIPFVRNSDETWKVGAGTASADVWNNISGTFRLPEGKYRLTGCPESGSGYTYFLYLRNNPQGAGEISVSDTGNGVEFTVTSELAQIDLVLFIAVKNGTTISNPVIYKPMICTVEQYALDPTYEPYHYNVVNTLREAEVIEGKNKLNNFLVSATDGTVTATTNSDKSVTVNGTPTSGTAAWFKLAEFPAGSLPVGRYILSGCPSGGSSQTYKLMIREDPPASWQRDDFGSGNEFDLTDTTKKYVSYIGVYGTASNVLFKPMLRLATETDPTYEPYYVPLKDSKADKSSVISALNGTVGWLGGNKWKNDVRTASVLGVTGNVNSNEQIVLTGAFTGADPNVILFGRISLKKGTYKLTGNDGSNDKIALQVYKAGVLNVYDYGNGGEFTLNADTSDILLRVYLNVGATIDTSLTLSPMLLTSEEYAISPSYRPYHESVAEMLQNKVGDTIYLNHCILSGHVTSGGSDIFVTLPFKCSTISGVTVDANCIVNARGNSGYIKDSAGTDISSSYKFVSNLKCSQILQGNNGITSVIIKNIDDNAFTNVTNNTPVALEFLGNITLT